MPDPRTHFKNLGGAALSQLTNFIVPVALLPILTRSLGVALYGEFAYILAVIQYFLIFTEWGFNLSATREVAVNRRNRRRVSEIFWSTVVSRILLCIVGYIVLEIGCWIFDGPSNLYRFAFLSVCSVAISPLFFFQGMEDLFKFSIINFLVKTSAIPVVWLALSIHGDLLLAVALPAFFNLLASAISFKLLLGSGEIERPRGSELKVLRTLGHGWSIFLSTASVTLYTNSNVVIVGMVSGPVAVGYFSAGMLIVRAVIGAIQPISQVNFVKISHAFAANRSSGIAIFRRLLFWQGGISFLLFIAVAIFGPILLRWTGGDSLATAMPIVRLLAVLVFLVGLSNVFGIQGLVPLGHSSSFSRILFLSGILNCVVLVILTNYYGEIGASLAVVLTEIFVTVSMGCVLFIKEPALFGWPNGANRE